MKYDKIYVVAPYGGVTGGVELAHQLVGRLRDMGHDAYIVYACYDKQIVSKQQDITKEYSMYNIATTGDVMDDERNLLILPEVFFEFILQFNKIRICCWWMSVDNRYNKSCFWDKFRFERSYKMRARLLLQYYLRNMYRTVKNSDLILSKNEDRILHLYQSHYAQFHLYSKGFMKLLPLSDYINLELIGDVKTERENIVLYNPLKGIEFTKKIIESLPQIKFIPLKGLSRNELRKLLSVAKLYIDFGHFPGKDRLPREAVANGCCIITGTLGASFFYEDVPIDNKYKFKPVPANLPIIIDKINFVLANYSSCFKDFEYYRQRVAKEKEIFFDEINDLFG